MVSYETTRISPIKNHVKSDKFPFLIWNNLDIYLIVFML